MTAQEAMEHLVTSSEAARQLGVCEETVRRRLRAGELPGTKLGQQWFVEQESLARYKQGSDDGG